MPGTIPFLTSKNHYRLSVPLQNEQFIFDVRWNSRDEAWYLDLREEDQTPILLGIKLLVGAPIGEGSNHEFFRTRTFEVVDTSGLGVDAGYDDLGARVQMVVTDASESLKPL